MNALYRVGVASTLLAASLLTTRPAGAQDASAPAQPQAAAPSGPSWQPDIAMAAGDQQTTNSLALVTGQQPGLYLIKGLPARINLRVVNPESARDLPVSLSQISPQVTTYRGATADYQLRIVDAETAIVEFHTSNDSKALAMMEVRTDVTATTTTLLPSFGGISITGQDGKVVSFQMVAPRPFRTPRSNGYDLVARLQPNERIRIIISTRERTEEEMRSLQTSALLDRPRRLGALASAQ